MVPVKCAAPFLTGNQKEIMYRPAPAIRLLSLSCHHQNIPLFVERFLCMGLSIKVGFFERGVLKIMYRR
jgi:hypothetical protein